MQRESCDVFIIGGGNAGFGVTVPTRKAGMKVIMSCALSPLPAHKDFSE